MNSRADTISTFDFEDFNTSSLEDNIRRIKLQPGWAELERRIHDAGYREGSERMRETMTRERQLITEGPLNQLGDLLGELGAVRAEFLKQNAEEIVHLAAALAARILRAEAAHNHEILRERLNRCLMQMERESSYLIRANADQVEALEFLIEETKSTVLRNVPYRIIADERVPAGSLVLEGDKSKLESICEDELRRLEEHLVELAHADADEGETDGAL